VGADKERRIPSDNSRQDTINSAQDPVAKRRSVITSTARRRPYQSIRKQLSTEEDMATNSDATILELFMKSHQQYDDIATYNHIFYAMKARNTMFNDQNILAVIECERITYTAEFQNKLAEFYEKNPRWSNDIANTRVLLDRWHKAGFSYVTVEGLERVANEGGLSESAQWKAAQAAIAERNRLIKSISQGQPTYLRFVPAVAAYRNFASADLNAMSNEDLAAIETEVLEARRLQGLDAAALKTEVQQTRHVYSRYEQIPADYKGTPWSAQLIRSLPSTILKGLLRTYGEQQLNDVIQGRR
jgi:hypothetical protein